MCFNCLSSGENYHSNIKSWANHRARSLGPRRPRGIIHPLLHSLYQQGFRAGRDLGRPIVPTHWPTRGVRCREAWPHQLLVHGFNSSCRVALGCLTVGGTEAPYIFTFPNAPKHPVGWSYTGSIARPGLNPSSTASQLPDLGRVTPSLGLTVLSW